MHSGVKQGPVFCADSELGYQRSRTKFEPGRGLLLDESYRLAHLPLVAPDHPRVIASREGKPYVMGRHPTVFSLGLPVDADALDTSPAFTELEREMRTSPFASKIAWDVLPRRRDKLHATFCNALGDAAPMIAEAARRELRRLAPMLVELRGLFSGNINVGRLYLRVYPECRDGQNLFRTLQRALGRPETDLYVVGLYNLKDDLDAQEAAAFASLIERWWDRPILRHSVDRLWLMHANDDLVLDGGIAEEIVP
jgi:hypothetical protein